MRAITRNFTDKVNIYGLVENGDMLEYSPIISDVPCHIQPQDGNYIEDSTGMYGKSYIVFMDYRTDVKEGTKLEVSTNETTYSLRVVEVESFDFQGRKRHIEARCRIFDNINKD
jgi:hypothetical protein